MSSPVDKISYDGVDYIAFSDIRLSCNDCAFNFDKPAEALCSETPCAHVIWLTELDYVKHRLTS